MYADLHLHSSFSDGTYTPEEVVVQAQRHGLAAVALTDHDTVEGCERMRAACERAGLEFLPGTELTAEVDGRELHLLAYCLDTEDPPLLARLATCQEVRQRRVHEMVARLNALHVPLAAEAVFQLANCRSPGRPHVARALVQGGFCATLDEAFERFLKNHRPAWVPKFRMPAAEAIALVHAAGGLAVLAHPALNRADDLIPELAAAGLDGLECFHTKHSSAVAAYYVRVAEQHHLLVTGGSDCHGVSKGKPLIGTVRLPFERVTALRAGVAARRRLAVPAARPPAPVSP